MTLATDPPAAGVAPGPGRGGAFATLVLSGANAIRLVAQLALLPILARLIGPADYGLVALAAPFVLFCNVMADGGLSTALAREQDPSPQLESTVFWIAGGIGASLALIACALALPIGLALGQPRLPVLIAALSPILALSGFTAAANARVIRERRFTVFAAGDLISTGASAAAALTAATHGWGAWSLVVQQLVLWVCKFGWVVSASRLKISLHCRPSEARALFRFGGHSIGATLGDFVTRNVDNVIVGGVLGTLALGYYAMAYQIIRVPDLVISGPLYLYIFSAVARAAEGRSDAAPQLIATSALRLSSTALAPVFIGLGLAAPLAVAVVLGPKWSGAGETLGWLCAAGFGFSMTSVAAATLMGLGRSELQLRLALIGGAATVCGVALAARFGVAAVGGAVAAITLAAMITYLVVLVRALKLPAMVVASAFAPAVIAGAPMALVLVLAQGLVSGLPPLARLLALAGLSVGVYGAVVAVVARRRLRQDLREFGWTR
jgi:O-antigen/teichoic acid export membrane protein